MTVLKITDSDLLVIGLVAKTPRYACDLKKISMSVACASGQK